MILVLTDKNDSHANFVLEKISKRRLPFYRLNLDVESLKNTSVCFKNFSWSISQNNNALILKDVKCIWNRRTFVELLIDEEYEQSVDFKIWKGEWNKTLLGIYSCLNELPWLNFWRNAYAAENKFVQMEYAVKCGLLIPETIVSNDKHELLNFVRQNFSVVLKLMQQDFYKINDTEYRGFYVNKIKSVDLEKMGALEENPVVLQKYIKKDYEVRYTVVGNKHFACKISSQESKIANIDWRRYDIPNTPHSIIDIPNEIEDKVNALMQLLHLEYGALDFIITKQKEWLFLEINSMGQYLWIEDLTGLTITDSLVDWMANHLL